jgi:hypothetical protein
VALRTTAAAVVGGTAADLAGGSFANGAISAAFQELFNDAMTAKQRRRDQLLEQRAVKKIASTKAGARLLKLLKGKGITYSFNNTNKVIGAKVKYTETNQKIVSAVITINPTINPLIYTTKGWIKAPLDRQIAHELGHVLYSKGSELDVIIEAENPVALDFGMPMRINHKGILPGSKGYSSCLGSHNPSC